MEVSSRRALLRQSTAAAHEALDSKIGALSSLPRYQAYALGLYDFRAPLEPILSAMAGDFVGPDWRPSRIAPELEQDLADLGLPKPRRRPIEAPVSRDEAIGYLYVLEGSALGARVLVKQVPALGLSAEWGARHLYKQAGGDPAHWRAFAAALDAPELNEDELLSGAHKAFAAASEAMGKALAHA